MTCDSAIRFGEGAEFNITIADGFELKKLILNGEDVINRVKDGKLVVENVSSELNFEIEFELIDTQNAASCTSSIHCGSYVAILAVMMATFVNKSKKRGEE